MNQKFYNQYFNWTFSNNTSRNTVMGSWCDSNNNNVAEEHINYIVLN